MLERWLQGLKAVAALSEDLGSITGIHVVTENHLTTVPEGLLSASCPRCTDVHTGKTPMYIQ